MTTILYGLNYSENYFFAYLYCEPLMRTIGHEDQQNLKPFVSLLDLLSES